MDRNRRTFRRWSAALVVAATCTVAHAEPGDFDPGFGSGGLATAVVNAGSYARATAVQSDGRVLVAGWDAAPTAQWRVRRLAADGSVDGTFGNGGSAVVFAGTDAPTLLAMALDGDKILGAGVATAPGSKGKPGVKGPAIARWTANGVLDTSFGTAGKVFLPTGTQATAIAVQPDHKVVVAGYASFRTSGVTQQGWFLARLLANGSLDSSFGSGGIVKYDPTPREDRIPTHGLALLGDGRIVLGGTTGNAAGAVPSWTVVRFSVSGTADASVVRAASVFDGLGVDAAGRIVAVGRAVPAGGATLLTRYLSSASSLAVDGTFGSGGETSVGLTGYDLLFTQSGLAFGSSGEIVTGAMTVPPSSSGSENEAWIVRLTASGLLDTSFGTGGFVGPVDLLAPGQPPGLTQPWGVIVDGFDRIVVGGLTYDGSGWAWFAGRLLGD